MRDLSAGLRRDVHSQLWQRNLRQRRDVLELPRRLSDGLRRRLLLDQRKLSDLPSRLRHGRELRSERVRQQPV